jgi:RHS repeat-associated protein
VGQVRTAFVLPAALQQISYTYDARNRLRNTLYGDGSPAIYRTYTADGLPDTIQSDGTLWSYGYNNRRLQTSETLNYGGVNYRIGRAYDANGSLSQLTYPDNFSVFYNPNAVGEARQAGSYATGVYYHPNGAIKQFSYGNGILHSLSQNVRGLPQLSQDGYVLMDSYGYDNNGNVTSIADQAEGVTNRGMEYDGLNRLKRVNAPQLWGDVWYNYDALDNITYSQVTGGAKARTLTHTIDYGANRLDSVTGSYSLGYRYDSQGNIIQRGGQSYSFDIGNRMRSAPGVTTHAYDGLGRRVSVVGTDGINRIYLYGQEGRLLYATTTGQALASGTKYVYLNRHVVAEVSGSGVVYDHTDGLGSPVAKTDAGAGLISRTRYEPYGATAAGAEPTIGFTGHLNAANLGLVDMQQRFYDPVAGRFLSIDPVVTDASTGGSFNRYAYANNSPYRYVDPDGRFAFLLPLVPILVDATVVVVGHHVLPGRQGREETAQKVLNVILNKGNTDQAGGTKADGQRPTKTPNEGAPGSTHINPGSGQERKYGSDGKPVQDIDHDHDHGQGVPHIHDWGRDANGRPVRGPGRPVEPKPEEKPKPDESK